MGRGVDGQAVGERAVGGEVEARVGVEEELVGRVVVGVAGVAGDEVEVGDVALPCCGGVVGGGGEGLAGDFGDPIAGEVRLRGR